jgi:hypothetical protein
MEKTFTYSYYEVFTMFKNNQNFFWGEKGGGGVGIYYGISVGASSPMPYCYMHK